MLRVSLTYSGPRLKSCVVCICVAPLQCDDSCVVRASSTLKHSNGHCWGIFTKLASLLLKGREQNKTLYYQATIRVYTNRLIIFIEYG